MQRSFKRYRLQCSTFRTAGSHKELAVGFNPLCYDAKGEITLRTNKKHTRRTPTLGRIRNKRRERDFAIRTSALCYAAKLSDSIEFGKLHSKPPGICVSLSDAKIGEYAFEYVFGCHFSAHFTERGNRVFQILHDGIEGVVVVGARKRMAYA